MKELKFYDVEDFIKDLQKIEGTDYGLDDNLDFLRRYSFVQFVKPYRELYLQKSVDEGELVLRINTYIKSRSNIIFKERNQDVHLDKKFSIWKYADLPEGMAISMSFVDAVDVEDFIGQDKYQKLLSSGLLLCVYDRDSRSVRHYARTRD